MIKILNTPKMEIINGGNAGDAFCAGFAAGSVVYSIGVVANWWNPIGWSGTVLLIAANAGCAAYGLR